VEKLALKDVTLKQFMAASEHLIVPGAAGKYIYNLVLSDPDGRRVEKENYWLTFDGGKITSGEGKSEDPEACEFSVLQGGIDTLIAMQIHGMKAAMNAMMLGFITASDLKKAEAWFKLLATGEDAVVAALAKAGVEITDTKLDIYGMLSLE
jgi:hypothetical protein